MIILKPIGTPQAIKFIGRVDVCDSVNIRDEQNNTTVNIAGTFTLSTYYLTASLIFSLTEGKHYTLTALNGSDVIYKDKVFCTAQTIADYSINNGNYTEQTSTNEFITVV